jgi:hypothetical protein
MDTLEPRSSEAPDPWADCPVATVPPEIITADHGGDTAWAYRAFGQKY